MSVVLDATIQMQYDEALADLPTTEQESEVPRLRGGARMDSGPERATKRRERLAWPRENKENKTHIQNGENIR